MNASRDETPLVVQTTRVKNSVDSSLLKNIICSPYYHQFIFCSLYQFVQDDNRCFEKGQYLQLDQIYKGCQPQLEGSEMSRYRVTALKIDSAKEALIEITLIEPGKRSASKEAKIIVSYEATKEDSFVFTLKLFSDIKDSATKALATLLYKQACHRLASIVDHFNTYLYECEFSGSLPLDIINDANFYDMTYGIGSKWVIGADISKSEQIINNGMFINRLLSYTEAHAASSSSSPSPLPSSSSVSKSQLSINDSYTTKISNMAIKSFKLEHIIEDVIFTVKKVGGNTIELTSNKGLANFHQFGIRISFEKYAENKTELSMAVFYSKSNFFAAAKSLQSAASFFTDKIPDPTLILFLRMRNMLDTYVRHSMRYFKQLNIDCEQQLAQPKSLQLCQATN